MATKPIRTDFDDSPNYNKFNVIKESPVSKQATFGNISENLKKELMNGTLPVYWACIFEYVNMVTNEKRIYTIDVKITKLSANRGWYGSFSENKNESVK